MRPIFPLFSNPIDLAHGYWKSILKQGDLVIDATLGNGKDTLTLWNILENVGGGQILAMDLQQKALENTHLLLEKYAPLSLDHIVLLRRSHATFPENLKPESARLIVYNLGYLPGADKTLTTKAESTLQSLSNALPLLSRGGCLSITCYPGHPEGLVEYEAVQNFAQALSPTAYAVTSHVFCNRNLSPALILIQKPL
jgi:hypothetical protein